MNELPRPRVFISYARSDGAAAAANLRERLEQAGVPLWRDREDLQGGRDWWRQITAAIDQIEFLVLVITPAALRSAEVRREWRYARQRGVMVCPVFDASAEVPYEALDFAALPTWMRRMQFYDLRHMWSRLVNDLQTRPPRVRVPFMVEDLPPDFVPRRAEYERLLLHLLDDSREEPIAITAALRGAGGYGKTALARALCHDEAIQNAFFDGILWVTLGEQPGDLTGRVGDLIYMLSGQRPEFAGLDSATAALAELLADRSMLIVIDDAWEAAHVRPFLQGGPRCARLITTRRADVPPLRAPRIDVDAMSEAEALALLGHGLPGTEAAQVQETLLALARRLGEWPLLLKLVNGALHDRIVRHGQAAPEALAHVNRALDHKGLTHFDARGAAERSAAVGATLGVSLAQLDDAQRDRLHELAVFPEDVEVPLDLVTALWARTAGLDEIDAEDLCSRLWGLSLLLSLDLTTRRVRLHDVVRQFLIGRLGDRGTQLHAALVATARPASGAWCDLPPDGDYWWTWLFTHLAAAGLLEELRTTARDLRYLARKSLERTALATEADLALACARFPADPALAQLRRAFAPAGYLLAACTSFDESMSTLLARLAFVPALADLTAAAEAAFTAPRLAPLTPPPDMPHPALIRTLGEHRGAMYACDLGAEGKWLVTADADRQVRLWDTLRGAELLAIKDLPARALALSRDGRTLAVATNERRLVLLDTATGRERLRCAGHVDMITAVALHAECRLAVTASLDHTLRLWDAETGALRHLLGRTWGERDEGWIIATNDQGHWGAVLACAISADGQRVASASTDQTAVVWDVHTGRALQVLKGHEAAVQACAFSPDGRFLATGSADRTVLVWNLDDLSHRLLAGHREAVKALAWSEDGRTLVSASADGALRAWEMPERRLRQIYTGHTDWVVGCAISAAAGLVASASVDGTARLWELNPAEPAFVRAAEPARRVLACAAVPAQPLLFTTHADRGLVGWDAASGQRVQSLRGHESEVRACATSRDGTRLASASADKTVIVWDRAGSRPLQTLAGTATGSTPAPSAQTARYSHRSPMTAHCAFGTWDRARAGSPSSHTSTGSTPAPSAPTADGS